jgi:signal transduction histidine kinase/ActR/RegA family two-component response regulator
MKRHLRLHAALVFACGFAFTAFVVTMLAMTASQRDRQRFEANALAAQDVVLDRIETSIALLRGAAGLLASRDEDPSVEEFRAYMNRVALRELYPGILGIGYTRRIAPEERATLEQTLQQQGHQGFRIWPEHARAQWHSIVLLEPLDERNRAAIGYDMFTHPVRRAAMERARDGGRAAASAIVELVQEIDARKQPGFLIYLPVYRGETVPATIEERRSRLRGFVYAPIRAEDFLASAFSHETRPSVSLRIRHERVPDEATLLYERAGGQDRAAALYHMETNADVAGEPWRIELWSSATLADALVVPILVALAGLGISTALAALLWREHHARSAIQAVLEREQAARGLAERSNRMKDEFLATLSHELRTPLNAIVGWASVLRSGRMSAAESGNALEVIDRNARAQARLIEDLLDTHRIVSGKLRLDFVALDPVRVLEAALDTVRPLARQKNIEVRQHVTATSLLVRADSARLQQVIWNLLSNAIKFTPAGGRIDVTLERAGARMRLSVADTGEGIEPRYIEIVFDRFAQADGSITRRHGGLGLGLAIVRELVALHGGSVRASSAGRGKGATFVVELPLVSGADEAQPDESEAKPAILLDGIKVLVAEDEPDARRLVTVVLEQRRARVLGTQSAAEALAAMDTFRPDVLVSDIGMAEVDGYELVRRVRARPAARGGSVPAVALTAYARETDRQEALAAGFQEYLVKPVQAEHLIAVVAALAQSARNAAGGEIPRAQTAADR